MSSISQARARRRRAAGPTLPGLTQPFALGDVEVRARGPGLAGRRLALDAVERERDVGVADQAHAVAWSRGTARRAGSRGRTPTRGRAGSRGRGRPCDRALGEQLAEEVEALLGDHLLSPVGRERRPARELGQRDVAADGEVVVADEAEVAVRARELDARVGLRAVADEVAEAPQLVDVLGRHVGQHGLEGVAVAVDVGEDRDEHGLSYDAWGGPGPSPTADRAGRRRRGRPGGGVDPAPPSRGDRPGSGERAIVLQRGGAGARAGLPQASARPRPGCDGGGERPPGPARRAPAGGSAVARGGSAVPGAGPALAGASPALAGAATGAGLSVALTAATLPLGAVAHRRAVAVGLSTQGPGSWLRDRALAGAIGTATAAAGGAGLLALARRFPRHWWAPGSAAAIGVGAAVLFAGPVVLDPLFNRFTALEPGETRDDVLALARDARVEVGEVYEVDASRRTTGANAYVTGLGATKRVVLFDTLLRDFARAEVALVVAHELSHVRHRDVPRGLLYLALVAPAAMLAAQRLAERLAPGRSGARR